MAKTVALAKTFLQKLYKMYTKIIQNTISVYVWYTKIVQIKILYDNECTKNVHQIPSYIQENKQNKSFLQNLYNVQTKNDLKLEMYAFCTYKQYTNYTKSIKLAN